MSSGTTSLVVSGQALMARDVRGSTRPGVAQVRELIRQADHAFTNLEVTMQGRFGGTPTKGEYLTVAPPVVLDSLKQLGFNCLALSNNHMFDLGVEGIMSTLEEVGTRGFAHAGLGMSLADASGPGFHESAQGRLGFVSMDCGPQPEVVYAKDGADGTPPKPGINGLKILKEGGAPVPDPDDAERNLELIRRARESADQVLVYVHNHHWEEVRWNTPAWLVEFAHRCVAAGASIFVGHGAPALQAMEVYQGVPVFYGLGNFFFHTKMFKRWQGEFGMRSWQSVLARVSWSGAGQLSGIELFPVCLGHDDDPGETLVEQLHDDTILAPEGYSRKILATLAELSSGFGTRLEIDGRSASVRLG